MEHAEAESLRSAYDQGSLSRDQVREIHAHWKGCEQCRSLTRIRAASAKRQPPRPGPASAKGFGVTSSEAYPPEIQAQMSRNRDMMVKLLALLALAWLVWKLKR